MTDNSSHSKRFSLVGRRALITGATRGIGWEISKAMAQAGAKVYINGRDAGTLDKRCREMANEGHEVSPALFDVTDTKAVEVWLDAQAEPPDILVNNAAMRHRYPISDITQKTSHTLWTLT